MSRYKRYPIAKSIHQLEQILKIEPARIMRRAGLSADFLENEGAGVTARDYHAIWDAVFVEIGGADKGLEIARKYAGTPFFPALLAYSSSPNTEIGLSRLALFKPLVGPIRLNVERKEDALEITISSSDPSAPMSANALAFELVYFLETMRIFTGHHVIPLAVGMPEKIGSERLYEDYLGRRIEASSSATLSLSLEDAHRPLISENSDFWASLEIDLKRQLQEQDQVLPIEERVRTTLIETLPSGDVSIDTVCKRLGMSRRSLQRHLKAAGASFQSILNETRSELSMRYLTRGTMSIEEIAYLLAYSDPPSFYRAFHDWTGTTPAQVRGHSLQ